MNKFKELIVEGATPKIDAKKLAKVIEKEFNTYGGPSASNAIEEYLTSFIDAALKAGMEEFNKTSASDRIYTMWAQDAGITDPEEIKGELEYYNDSWGLEVSKIDIRTKD